MVHQKYIYRIGLFVLLVFLWQVQGVAASPFRSLPGALEFADDAKKSIAEAWESRNPNHEVRSKHVNEDGTPHYANRLILELSPYLNQHAHNPVDWHSWGEEAFEMARQHDRPVLVSIGYSSCHWCHVMEEESYDNLKIARLLNENYIAIKVDREVNPDVDELYMLAVQLMGGFGGWPLHVFVTPEGKPFFGLVYVPPEDFEEVLNQVHQVWKTKREEVDRLAGRITQQVQSFGASSDAEIELGKMQVDQFVAELLAESQGLDEFSPPTERFPSESELFLLLDTAVRHDDKTALHLATSRLLEMAKGGIRDHVGGGFHRYSVDNEWLVPHFEKMLYNQALLARAYLIAFELTGESLYRRVAEQTLDYVLRDMRSDTGVFWSATDADSEGKEGAFFIWTADEIVDAVGSDADFVINHYGVTPAGNFEGANILHISEIPESHADKAGVSIDAYLEKLKAAVEKMRLARDQREKPYLDDKVITAWNSMMITTLAWAGAVLEKEHYLDAAVIAADFLWLNAWNDEKEHLYRIMREGRLQESGKLKDYAYFAESMLTLYDKTGGGRWLERAKTVTDAMISKFWDSERGGFYSVSENDSKNLIARHKDRFDEGLPSGNAVAARSLSLLYDRTGQFVYDRLAQRLFQSFAAEILQVPLSYGYSLKALEEHSSGLIGNYEYVASGNAKVSVHSIERRADKVSAVVEVELADGWHVQSNNPIADNLVATRVSNATDDWVLEQVDYPPAKKVVVSFQSDPLSVWSGDVKMPFEMTSASETVNTIKISLQLQACNDEVCLLPETTQLEIPAGQLTG